MPGHYACFYSKLACGHTAAAWQHGSMAAWQHGSMAVWQQRSFAGCQRQTSTEQHQQKGIEAYKITAQCTASS
jgi:hypothetical protein